MNNFKSKIGFKNNLDKLLFVIATIYLMIVLGWFWKHQKIISSSSNIVNPNQKSQNNYPQNSEINNDTSTPINNTNLVPSNIKINQLKNPISSFPQPPTNTDIATNALNIPPLPNTDISSSNFLPPPPSVLPLPISQPPQPKLSPPTPTLSNPINASSINPPPPPIASKPTSSVSKLTKVPTINTLNVNTQNNNQIPPVATIPQKTQIQTNYNYTLIGIVELGNSGSVALFNINNLTEKVPIGNEIGTTGWVLMGLNGTQAVITRQNQSVYLRVGETF
ncbi:hypothetical protein GM3708_3430 [Geminocystis sp. NIES-3708]|uniref:hypothetical protein n=1 Tax=Geminocystis sp. NIES-3708 TaxID=1615909 RepID=UPI0005FC9333|nr:hypothetical protein [Geminocystis sp. NIES-3708]BAQ63024.1 hypothetical protein GM3708_3430 [Geminocystis sp. NIES-3708]